MQNNINDTKTSMTYTKHLTWYEHLQGSPTKFLNTFLKGFSFSLRVKWTRAQERMYHTPLFRTFPTTGFTRMFFWTVKSTIASTLRFHWRQMPNRAIKRSQFMRHVVQGVCNIDTRKPKGDTSNND